MVKVCKLKFVTMIIAAAMFGMLGCSPEAMADQSQEWELIIPLGEVMQTTIKPASRLTDLDGKTIVLRWNGKHNGDNVLNHLADLLAKQYPTAKIVKSYEMTDNAVALNTTSGNPVNSENITNILRELKPDLVIASQAD